MDNTNTQTAATATEGAGPDTSPAPEQQSAPTKSAAETKLENQLKDAKAKSDTYKKERDTARGELKAVTGERDELRTENEQLKQQAADKASALAASTEPTEAAAPQEPSEEDNIKNVLKRNGLKKCWMLESGPCFSEAHAKEYAGADFDSLTVISLDTDAGTN